MKKVKVIVFDFDNTLYSGVDWSQEWARFCEKGLRYVFRDWSDKDFYKMIDKEMDSFFTSDKMISVIEKYDKKVSDWLDFRIRNTCTIDYSRATCISNDELKKFAEKHKLYIVSNSTAKDINYVSTYFKMDLSVFKEIIINDYKNGPDKKFYYEEIIKKEHIEPQQLLVIGDSEETDIKPALEVGAKVKLVRDCSFKFEDFKEL